MLKVKHTRVDNKKRYTVESSTRHEFHKGEHLHPAELFLIRASGEQVIVIPEQRSSVGPRA